MEYRKDTIIEVRLYKEEIEDIVRALDYYMENVDLESLNKKYDDKYEKWYKSLRTGLNNIVSADDKEWYHASCIR